MNYLKLINTFWAKNLLRPLASGQIAVFLYLCNLANLSSWEEWFPVSLQMVGHQTQLSPSGVQKAKNALIEMGYIEVRKVGKGVEVKIAIKVEK